MTMSASPAPAPRVLYAKGGAVVDECRRLLGQPLAAALPQGGPDLFLLAVAQRFGQAGQLLVTSIGSEAKAGSHHCGQAIEYGARPQGGPAWQRRLAYVTALRKVVTDSLAHRPQLILAGVEGPFAAAYWLAARLLRCPLVFLVHVAPDQPSLSGLTRKLNRFVARRAQAVIVHGPYLKACVADLGVPASRVIEFDTGVDVPQLAINPLPPAVPTFVFAGRIEQEKGVFDLLEAFTACRAQAPLKLIYYGDGGARQALQEAARAHPHASDIEVRGKAPQAEVFAAIAGATATVTPTRSSFPEGRCMTVLESLAMGTPVIAPDFGPFPYALTDQVNGLLYPADEVPALARCLQTLCAQQAAATRIKQGALQTQRTPRVFTSFSEALSSAAGK
jgi:glycosyltransferase involved in cell wall biosynthesis